MTAVRLPNPDFWRGRRVFVTGHTGFKGSWLSLMLRELGASVYGLSNGIPTEPSHFIEARVSQALVEDLREDVRDLGVMMSAVQRIQPDVILHLAAQPLVLEGVRDPVETFSTNVMGTVNILEAARRVDTVSVCIIVTTDKVYRSGATEEPHSEDDELGGSEPYGASKAAAEMVAASFAALTGDSRLRVATARAGNVIGGGDWSPWRLLPDLLSALDRGEPVSIRSLNAVRPWQHVLDPVVGYLLLAESSADDGIKEAISSWNFGPDPGAERRVIDVIREVEKSCGQTIEVVDSDPQPVESAYLAVSSAKARNELGWRPHLDFASSVAETVTWHRAWRDGKDMADVSRLDVHSRLEFTP